MDGWTEFDWSYVLWPTAAALIIAIIARRGLLSHAALESRPIPRVPLAPIDLIPIAGMWAIGQVIASTLFIAVSSPSDATTQPDPANAYERFDDPMLVRILVQLVAQIVAQLPLILYILWAFATRPTDESNLNISLDTLRQTNSSRIAVGLENLGVTSPTSTTHLVRTGLLALLAGVPIVFGVNQLTVAIGEFLGHPPPESGHKLLTEFTKLPSPFASALLLLSILVVAPALEEFIFRGMLQSCLRSLGSRWQTITIASAIFALMHYQVAPVQVLPGLFSLGLMLGWLYERTGSLVPGITLHAGFNLTNIILFYLIQHYSHPTTQPA